MQHLLCYFQAVTTALAQVDREKIYQWINELSSPETRENALLELSKKRESVPDLAPMLWHSCGTIAALLQVSWGSVFHRSRVTRGGVTQGWAREAHGVLYLYFHFPSHCQEIVNIYPSINPPTLTAHQSNRVCNALALLQCVASHPETRQVVSSTHRHVCQGSLGRSWTDSVIFQRHIQYMVNTDSVV